MLWCVVTLFMLQKEKNKIQKIMFFHLSPLQSELSFEALGIFSSRTPSATVWVNPNSVRFFFKTEQTPGGMVLAWNDVPNPRFHGCFAFTTQTCSYCLESFRSIPLSITTTNVMEVDPGAWMSRVELWLLLVTSNPKSILLFMDRDTCCSCHSGVTR